MFTPSENDVGDPCVCVRENGLTERERESLSHNTRKEGGKGDHERILSHNSLS